MNKDTLKLIGGAVGTIIGIVFGMLFVNLMFAGNTSDAILIIAVWGLIVYGVYRFLKKRGAV